MWNSRIVHPSNQAAYWAGQAKEVGTTLVDAGPATVGCNHLGVGFSRTVPAGTREDRMYFNLHIAKTAGTLFSFETSGTEMATLEGLLDAWWTTVKALSTNQVSLVEYRWHVVRDDSFNTYSDKTEDPDRAYKADKLGPAFRVTTRAVAGSVATSRLPDQVAATCTFRTASRRHWGRVYVPGIAFSQIDNTWGRLSTAYTVALAGAFRTLANALVTNGYELIVWSPSYRSGLTIRELMVDDIPDIQRRRRGKQASVRTVLTS
jgi:hypothetical protein